MTVGPNFQTRMEQGLVELRELLQVAPQATQVPGVLGRIVRMMGQGNPEMEAIADLLSPPTDQEATPQQMQQAQNANASQISQGAQTQNQTTANSLAGRGFGSNSPLAMSLQSANDSAARGQIASSNTQLGLQGAQANATQLTNSQNALSNQWATGNQLDINRRTPYVQQRTALLQSLAGLV